jgi:hypothetical protein
MMYNLRIIRLTVVEAQGMRPQVIHPLFRIVSRNEKLNDYTTRSEPSSNGTSSLPPSTACSPPSMTCAVSPQCCDLLLDLQLLETIRPATFAALRDLIRHELGASARDSPIPALEGPGLR